MPNKIKGFLNKGTTVEVNETNVVKIVSLERPLRSVEQVGFGRKSDGLLHITEHREREREADLCKQTKHLQILCSKVGRIYRLRKYHY